MNRITYPSDKRIFLYNKLEKLDIAQTGYYNLLMQISDIVNRAMIKHRDPVSGNFIAMSFTEFLETMHSCYEEILSAGDNRLLFDDFIRIAHFSINALTAIIRNPSTHIEKITTNVPVYHFKQSSSKTVRWLAQRSGRTIAEKIAPQNKIASSKTLFSANTKENQETMYLYRIMYDMAAARRNGLSENGVNHSDSAEFLINRLLKLHVKVRQGELADVPAKKQAVQNNKLMCDKHYKIIWDSVKQIANIGDKIEQDWNNIKSRYAIVFYWFIIGEIFCTRNVTVPDFWCRVIDYEGSLYLLDENRLKQLKRAEHDVSEKNIINVAAVFSTTIINNKCLENSFNISVIDNMIMINTSNKEVTVLNFNDIFNKIMDEFVYCQNLNPTIGVELKNEQEI